MLQIGDFSLDFCVKLFYTDSAYPLNPLFPTMKVILMIILYKLLGSYFLWLLFKPIFEGKTFNLHFIIYSKSQL
jgi:hypothetical protein